MSDGEIEDLAKGMVKEIKVSDETPADLPEANKLGKKSGMVDVGSKANTSAKATSIGDHCATHFPADPNCPHCRLAKLRKKTGLRKGDVSSNWTTVVLYRIHVDLVGPTNPAVMNEIYAFISHDEATQ